MIATDSKPITQAIHRAVDSVPRRSATETWGPVHALLAHILQEHERGLELAEALAELQQVLPPLFMHRAVQAITLRCGDVLNVVVVVGYGGASAEQLVPPIAVPPELAGEIDVSLTLSVSSDNPLSLPVDEPLFMAGDLIPVYIAPFQPIQPIAQPEQSTTKKGN